MTPMTYAQKLQFVADGEALLTDLLVAFTRNPDIYGRVDDPASTADNILGNFRIWLYEATTVEDARRWTSNIQAVLVDVQGATGENVSAWPSWYALVQTVSMMAVDALDTATRVKDAVKVVTNNPGKVLLVVGALATWAFFSSAGRETARSAREDVA